MVREIITLSLGQCGVRFGSKVWERYSAESSLNSNIAEVDPFFAENGDGTYTARSIFCDSSLYNSLISPSKLLHDPRRIVAPKEDCGNLYARGAYTSGKESLQNISDIIRKMADNCDMLQGFIVNHSITGGTSSGLTAQVLEDIGVDYRRKCRFGFEVCPAVTYNKTDSICDPYNMILSMHHLIDNTDLSIMFDNEALHKLCRNKLNVHHPSYDNLNELIVKTLAHFTQDLRPLSDDDECQVDMSTIQSDNICFPRLHFLTPSVSVIEPKYNPLALINGYVRSTMENQFIYQDVMRLLYRSYDIHQISTDPLNLTRNVFKCSNFLMDYPNFDVLEDKYMACRVQYRACDTLRGEPYSMKNLNLVIRQVTRNEPQNMSFVEWVPTYCKPGVINKTDLFYYKNKMDQMHGILAEKEASAVMFGNNTAFGRWSAERISNKFNKMFDRRAFVHWYYNEAMEEVTFREAREDLEWLQQDYTDVLAEEATDSDYDEDDEGQYNREDFVISSMSEQQMIDKALKDSLEDWKSSVADLPS